MQNLKKEWQTRPIRLLIVKDYLYLYSREYHDAGCYCCYQVLLLLILLLLLLLLFIWSCLLCGLVIVILGYRRRGDQTGPDRPDNELSVSTKDWSVSVIQWFSLPACLSAFPSFLMTTLCSYCYRYRRCGDCDCDCSCCGDDHQPRVLWNRTQPIILPPMEVNHWTLGSVRRLDSTRLDLTWLDLTWLDLTRPDLIRSLSSSSSFIRRSYQTIHPRRPVNGWQWR